MKRTTLLAALVAAAIPFSALAHKQWLIPSQAVVNGDDVWVTFDGAVSNQLFHPDHVPMRLDNIVVTAPDGSTVRIANAATGKYRSTFDVPLEQQGTYRISNVNAGVSARWDAPDGQCPGPDGTRMPAGPRGCVLRNATPADLATRIPQDAKNVVVTEAIGRVETFVTNGSTSAIVPVGKGLELLAVTHPNDLFAGEAAQFRLAIDGKPAPGLDVEAIRGGTRFRNAQEEIKATSDEGGVLDITFPEPGLYWLEVATEDDKASVEQARSRRLSYVVTLEVLPQ